MYPNFRIINNIEFGIGDAPFIYCGPSINIPVIEKCNIPHIIISTNRDYDLSDRNTLIDLACKKNNIGKLSNIEYLYYISWNEFLRAWKQFWLKGIKLKGANFPMYHFNKILKNVKYPNFMFL